MRDFYALAASMTEEQWEQCAQALLRELEGRGADTPAAQDLWGREGLSAAGEETLSQAVSRLARTVEAAAGRPGAAPEGKEPYLTLRSRPYGGAAETRGAGTADFLRGAGAAGRIPAAAPSSAPLRAAADAESVSGAVERESRRSDGPFERY